MNLFSFYETELQGPILFNDFFSRDNRGCFAKCFEKESFSDYGINFNLSETFFTVSKKNVIRGLHFQLRNPQAKLVSVLEGRVWDVIVDLRINSPTFKRWEGFELSSDNHRSLYIPKGFAHGFVAMEDFSLMLYQCDGKYDKDTDTGIIWNDVDLAIKWPINKAASIHSEKDLSLMTFEEYMKNPIEVK